MRTLGTILLLGAIASGVFFAFKQGEKNNERKNPKKPEPKQPETQPEKPEAQPTKPESQPEKPETQPEKDLVDKMFDLAFEKIRQSNMYKSQSSLKRGVIDTTMAFINNNRVAKEKIKTFAESNKIPIENAIILELFPKK